MRTRKTGIMVIRPDVLRKILDDPEFGKRMDSCQSTDEIAKVCGEYCRKHGHEVKEIDLDKGRENNENARRD